MKTLYIYASLLLGIFAVNNSFAQKTNVLDRKEKIKVWGNCEVCKNRIENAALNAGAKTAYWNVDSHILSISYDGAKTSSEKIQKAIGSKGHDTLGIKADDEVYNKLPGCCRYERNNTPSGVSL